MRAHDSVEAVAAPLPSPAGSGPLAAPRPLGRRDARSLERCLRRGGVAVVPTDTVYGLACDPLSGKALSRLYELKGRAGAKPAAVMFLDLGLALASVREAGPRTLAAIRRLLPGPATVIAPNPSRRFPLACGSRPERIGLRVPLLARPILALGQLRRPLLQSSANSTGGPDPATVEAVPVEILDGADLVLDAGELSGTPSTVVDLTAYERRGAWRIVRKGAVSREALEPLLGSGASARRSDRRSRQ